jgi:peroxiredoxin
MIPMHAPAVRGTVSVAFICTFAAFATTASAQSIDKSATPTTPSDEKSGEAQGPNATRLGRYLIGDPAPDISLKDDRGRDFRLSDERKKGPVLVGFARVPEDAIEIERARAALEASGISAVVIAPFHPDKLADLVGATKVRFLHDRTGRIAELYGLFDAVTSTPRSGAMLIDERQRIRLIVAGIMPSGDVLAHSSTEAMEQARTGKVAE